VSLRWKQHAKPPKGQKQSRYVCENTSRVSERCSATLAFERCGLFLQRTAQGHRAGLALPKARNDQRILKCKNEAIMSLKTKDRPWVRLPKRTHSRLERTQFLNRTIPFTPVQTGQVKICQNIGLTYTF
jgi:hypothetical protein